MFVGELRPQIVMFPESSQRGSRRIDRHIYTLLQSYCRPCVFELLTVYDRWKDGRTATRDITSSPNGNKLRLSRIEPCLDGALLHQYGIRPVLMLDRSHL